MKPEAQTLVETMLISLTGSMNSRREAGRWFPYF